MESLPIEAERTLATSRLAAALGRPSSERIARLLALGLTAETASAFRLLPLVEVAWADGSVDPDERRRLLAGARRLGLVPGDEAQNLLESWLEIRPDDEVVRTWHELASEDRARGVAPDERWRLLEDAEAVASASGGAEGAAPVSGAERRTLDGIEASIGTAKRER